MFSPWKHTRADFLRLNAKIEAEKGRAALRDYYRRNPPPHSNYYNPNQPRVPPGHPDGGQWRREGSGSEPAAIRDVTQQAAAQSAEVLSDADPASVEAWSKYAQLVPAPVRASARFRSALRFPGANVSQLVRLEIAEFRETQAIRDVREREPGWKPREGVYGPGIESAIRRANDRRNETIERLAELRRVCIGPGWFAREFVVLHKPGRRFNASEIQEINRIGERWGCHGCGTKDPGTASGNYIRDHQLPSAMNPSGRDQRGYPHCVACSARQGAWLKWNRYRR